MAVKIINGVKHYPAFRTEARAHDFEYARNHALNTLDDARHGLIELTAQQEAELEETVEKVEAVLDRLSWPITYLPWPLYQFAKETIGWAACSRDAAAHR